MRSSKFKGQVHQGPVISSLELGGQSEQYTPRAEIMHWEHMEYCIVLCKVFIQPVKCPVITKSISTETFK